MAVVSSANSTVMNNVEAVRATLYEAMKNDERTVILGEDVGARGNVFLITKDFIGEFGERRVIEDVYKRQGYETAAGGRPRFGLIPDPASLPGSTRLAFAVETRGQVDAAAEIVRKHGARAIEGPGLHPEYGDYYAVFFEDAEGNKFEITADGEARR